MELGCTSSSDNMALLPETFGPETKKLMKRILHKLDVEHNPRPKPIIPISDPISRAARYTGIHREAMRKMAVSGKPLDVDEKEVNRQMIHKELMSMYLTRKEIPTVTKFFDVSHHLLPIHADLDYFLKTLVKMGYVFYKFPNHKCFRVMESKTVTFERCRYLNAIREYRKINAPIVYIGVASQNATTKEFLNSEKSLKEDNYQTVQSFFFTVNENEIKHIKLVDTISTEVLKKWLIEYVLHDLPSGSVCILEDLEIFRETLIDIPTVRSVKVDMIEWLTEHNVPFDMNMTKLELFDLIQSYTDVTKNTYVIDNIVKTYNHTLLRLPACINEFSIVHSVLTFLNTNSILKHTNLTTINATFDCISRIQLNTYSDLLSLEELTILNEDMMVDDELDKLVESVKNISTEDEVDEDDIVIPYLSDTK